MKSIENESVSRFSPSRVIARIAILAALICVVSPFSVSIGPIPYSFGLLAVFVASSLVDFRHGVAAVVVYVLLGAFGVPVFTGFSGGLGKVLGPTGGFIFGYIPCAAIIGFLVDRADDKIFVYPLSMILGTVVLYLFGIVWFVIALRSDFITAFLACAAPFLWFDALKIVAATALCFPLRKRLKSAGLID